MDTARKIIGCLMIVFLGLPTLFVIIWAVGMIRASVSPDFLTELPREIIARLPDSVDELFREARSGDVITDDRTRAWFEAAARAGVSPRELLEKTGMMAWLEDEVSDSLREFGLVLKGERRPRPITINLRPLKAALFHPETERLLMEVLDELPACDEAGMKAWADVAASGLRRSLPACKPDPAVAQEFFRQAREKFVSRMKDEFEVIEPSYRFPVLPSGVSGFVSSLSYLLFLIPAAFIFFGALVGANSPAGVLRWSGVSVLAGGVPAFLLSLGTKSLSLWAIASWPHRWHEAWPTEFGELALEKLSWIPARVVDRLFSPVVGVAAVVCVAGIVLYALSFTVRDGSGRTRRPVLSGSAQAPKTE